MTRDKLLWVVAAILLVGACEDASDSAVGVEPEQRAEQLVPHEFAAVLPVAAAAINDHGEVAGSVVVDGKRRAAVWARGQVTPLPGLGGATSTATAINNRGDVAGAAENPDGNMRAVLWRRGTIVDLGTLGGDISMASAMNNAGDVVGSSEDENGALHGFLWRAGEMIKLNPPAQYSSNTLNVITGINDRREVVGWTSFGLGFGLERGFLWADGESMVLDRWEEVEGPRGGRDWFETYPEDINNRGQIVGAGFPSFQNWIRAVMWESGEIMDVGALGSCPPSPTVCQFASSAAAINDAGIIVGRSQAPQPLSCGECPFIWKQGVMVPLTTRDGSVLSGSPVDINNAGTVLGRDWIWNGSVGQVMANIGRNHAGTSAVSTNPRLQPRRWSDSYCRAEGRDRSSPLESLAGC